MVVKPDYEFYRNEFCGRSIDAAEDFAYYAERAGDELALFVRILPDKAQNDYSRCICAVAEIVRQEANTSRNGKPVTSESVNGYYSVSYGQSKSYESRVSDAVCKYLRPWLCGAARVRM